MLAKSSATLGFSAMMTMDMRLEATDDRT